jgi:hypothetical protein
LADRCPESGQRVSDWLDENGKELRDWPFEVVETLCPPCEALGYAREEMSERAKEGGRGRHGIHLSFRRVARSPKD